MSRPASSDGGGVSPPRKNPAGEPVDDLPGVPGFRSWRAVYWFVFACFVAVVIALTIFSRHYA